MSYSLCPTVTLNVNLTYHISSAKDGGRQSKCCHQNQTQWNYTIILSKINVEQGTLMMRHLSLHVRTYTPLTMSLGCVVLTCHTLAFVLCLHVFSCLVLLYHTSHFFLCHISSDEGNARKEQ